MVLEERAPFNPKAFLNSAGEGKTITQWQKQQTIFAQGDPADSIFYIQTGKVKLTVVSEQGKEAITEVLGVNEFFGEGCLAGQLLRMSSAISLTESSILRITKPVMKEILQREKSFSEFFTAGLLSRMIRMEENLMAQFFDSSEKRLARVLLSLADRGRKENSAIVIPRISQETLAEMVGTTRPRINFFLKKFRKLGFIYYNGGLEVRSSLLNLFLQGRVHLPHQNSSPVQY
jgi:CRP-like cAMP-binding protein